MLVYVLVFEFFRFIKVEGVFFNYNKFFLVSFEFTLMRWLRSFEDGGWVGGLVCD